ncbi:MAG: ABC transporter ATP-binding protein [Clostridia bacterium]
MKRYNPIVEEELKHILPYHLLGVVLHSIVIYMAFKIPECIGNILDLLTKTTLNEAAIWQEVYWLLFYSSAVFIPRTLYRICYFTISRKADTYLRKEVIRHLQKVKPSYFEKENKGAFLAYLSKEIISIHKVLGNICFWLTKMCITPTMAIILIWNQFNKELALYLLPAFPLAILAMRHYYKRLREKIELSRKAYVELSKNIEQNTEGFLLVKSYNRQEEQKKHFDQVNQNMYQADYEIGVIKNKISSVINYLYAFCYIVGFGMGLFYIEKGMVTIGGLVTFLGYITQILGDFISAIQSFLERFPYYRQSIHRFNYFLNLEEIPREGKPLEKVEQINIQHLSYWYDNGEKPVLRNIEMTIKKGEKIGIVGQVGSGKTTLMNILTGFYEVPEGMVFFNGQDIHTYQPNTIYEHFNYAIQQNIILDDTIKANIDIVENLRPSQLEKVLEKAQLHEDIEQLEDRENTLVGERGVKLSGGQKQRISIARNLGTIRDVNIFDDTLSALDSHTERKIMENLIEAIGDNTLIVISNKISNVEKLDRIYILLEGEIQDVGTHEALLQRNAFYQELDWLERKEEADESNC